MKGIYVTDGMCVYGGCRAVSRRRQYSRLPNLQEKSKKVRVIGNSKKIAGSKKKNSFSYTVNILITHLIVERLKRQLKGQKRYF